MTGKLVAILDLLRIVLRISLIFNPRLESSEESIYLHVAVFPPVYKISLLTLQLDMCDLFGAMLRKTMGGDRSRLYEDRDGTYPGCEYIVILTFTL